MEKYEKIIHNEEYKRCIDEIEEYEKNRQFGHHDMSHFLDVARVGMILNLTEDYKVPKTLLYAAALLHDVGRAVQYKDGTDHDIASVEISTRILETTDYTPDEKAAILKAIGDHRTPDVKETKTLSGLLYRADKLCRPCFWCMAEKECNWKSDKKNMELIW